MIGQMLEPPAGFEPGRLIPGLDPPGAIGWPVLLAEPIPILSFGKHIRG